MKEEERPKLFAVEKMLLLADDFPILYLDRQRQPLYGNQVDSMVQMCSVKDYWNQTCCKNIRHRSSLISSQ